MRGRDRWVYVGLLGLVAISYGVRLADPTLPESAALRYEDLKSYFVPSFHFLQSSIARGDLPLWNPYEFAGVPFLANHVSAALYPPLWVFLPLPAHFAILGHAVLHLGLLTTFMWLLGRRLGFGWSGSCAAALAFAFSNPVVSDLYNVAYLSNVVWLPAVFWALHRLVTTPTARRAVALILIVSMSFLSGHSQGFLYSMQSAGLYCLLLLAIGDVGGRRRRILVLLGLSALWSLLLVSAQLLPFLELASSGTRSLEGLSFEVAAAYSISPDTLRLALLGVTNGPAGLPILFLPLAVAALAVRRHRALAIFFFVLFLGVRDFMAGSHGFVFPLYFELPFGNLFRVPVRSSFLYAFSAAMLIGAGTSHIVQMLGRLPHLAVAVGAALGLLVAADQLARNPLPVRYDPLVDPQSIYGPAPLAEFARNSAGTSRIFIERWYSAWLPRKFGTVHRVFTMGGYEPVLPGGYRDLFGINGLWHGQLSVTPSPYAGSRQPPSFIEDPRLLDLLSVRYYADGRAPPPTTTNNPLVRGSLQASRAMNLMVRVDGDFAGFEGTALIRRSEALPRTYIVHDVVSVDSEQEALERVRALDFDLHAQAIVIGELPGVAPAAPHAEEGSEVLSYAPNEVSLRVRCETACLAVLTDLFYPGWRVTVDGEPGEIVRVNFLLRGVVAPPGTHEIVYEFRPRSFAIGAFLSVGALLGLIAFAVVPGRVTAPKASAG